MTNPHTLYDIIEYDQHGQGERAQRYGYQLTPTCTTITPRGWHVAVDGAEQPVYQTPAGACVIIREA